jgi:hypothetical protein
MTSSGEGIKSHESNCVRAGSASSLAPPVDYFQRVEREYRCGKGQNILAILYMPMDQFMRGVAAWRGSQHQAYLNEFVLHILDKIQPRRAIVLQYEDRQVSVAKSRDETVAEDKHWAWDVPARQ